MENFIQEVQVRWSDLDPNFHLRHSVYYDWGAFCRISLLEQHNLTAAVMQRLQIGPILFREECVFKKEIRLGDKVTINLELIRAKRDFARWSIRHTVVKNDDTVSALITVDGAWLDLARRKLATPPQEVHAVFSQMPVSVDFEWLD
ncbi:MAG TPA: acyl-CoA thioesterase [Chitinophagaceae bacterium]|nr:acyl-CoA thioesterase [Chitinophagaceae bacterium]